MANINIENISDLALNGNDLFEDSESFITELSDDGEQEAILGGLLPDSCPKISCVVVSEVKTN